MTKIYDNSKLLSQKELELIQQQAENLDFDWVKEAELEVYISEEVNQNGLNIQVLVENNLGYFGWNTNHSIMADEIKKEFY
jgi:hypothetical protein